MESQINSIFSEEWFSQFAKIDKSRTLDQVRQAMAQFVEMRTRSNEIKAIIGKNPSEIDLDAIARNSTPGEIINDWPRRAKTDLDKAEMMLKDFQSR